MKTQSLIPLLFALTFAGSARGQEASKLIDPKAKAVLEKSIEALGGKEAMANIKTRTAKGKIEMPAQGLSMSLEIKQKAPLSFYSKAVIPELITAEQGFNGEEGWSKDTIQGFRKLAGAELAQAKENSAMFYEQLILENLAEAKTLPDSANGDQKLSVIEVKTEDESTKTLYFDQDTHLLARVVSKTILGPDSEMDTDMLVSDYKEIDGVKVATSVTMTTGPQKIIMKMSDIEHNKEIDDEVFKMEK